MTDLASASPLSPAQLPPGNDNAPRSWRTRLADIAESAGVQRFVTALIVVNAVTLGLETAPSVMDRYGFWLEWIDHIILWVFVAELAAAGKRFQDWRG